MVNIKEHVRLAGQALRTLNVFEALLLGSIMALAIASFVIKGEFSANSCIAAVAAILGVFCVVLGAKGSLANWIFGVVEAVLHIYICFCTHIYGDFLQRLLYNMPMQVVGFRKWKKRVRDGHTITIHTRYMTWRQRFYTLLAVAVGTFALGEFLYCFGPWLVEILREWLPDMVFKTLKTDYANSWQLWLDSLTTVLSIIALWISVRAFVEQWYIWLIINVSYITLWLMSDSDFSFMTVAKYSVYLINSFYGLYMWNKLSKE